MSKKHYIMSKFEFCYNLFIFIFKKSRIVIGENQNAKKLGGSVKWSGYVGGTRICPISKQRVGTVGHRESYSRETAMAPRSYPWLPVLGTHRAPK